jgi:hypothetical protein
MATGVRTQRPRGTRWRAAAAVAGCCLLLTAHATRTSAAARAGGGARISYPESATVSLDLLPADLEFVVPGSGRPVTGYTVAFSGLPAGLAVATGALGTGGDACTATGRGAAVSYHCVHRGPETGPFTAIWSFTLDRRTFTTVRGGHQVRMTLVADDATRTGTVTFNTTNSYSQGLASDLRSGPHGELTSPGASAAERVDGVGTSITVGAESTVTNAVFTLRAEGAVPVHAPVTIRNADGAVVGNAVGSIDGDTETVRLGTLPAGQRAIVYVPEQARADQVTVTTCLVADQTDVIEGIPQLPPCTRASYTVDASTGTSGTAVPGGGVGVRAARGGGTARSASSGVPWIVAGATTVAVIGAAVFFHRRRRAAR